MSVVIATLKPLVAVPLLVNFTRHRIFYCQPVGSDHIEIACLRTAHGLLSEPSAPCAVEGPAIDGHAAQRQGMVDGPARPGFIAIELPARQEVNPDKIGRAGSHLLEVTQRGHLCEQTAIQPAGSQFVQRRKPVNARRRCSIGRCKSEGDAWE
jgi:hypothetical protein